MIKIGNIFVFISCISIFTSFSHATEFVFIENEINLSQVYVGQPFLLKTYVTHKGNIKSIDLIETDFSQGASIEDLENSPDLQKFTKIIKNGFFKQQIFTKVVTPFRVGKFSIEGAMFRIEFKSNPGFYKIVSPKKIFYKTLPFSKENSLFNGSIGNISIKKKIISSNKKEIQIGETVQIELEFTSLDGGVKLMKIPLQKKSEHYIINTKTSIHKYFLDQNKLCSSKKFVFLFTPRRPGTILFPEIKILSFLPSPKNYKSYKLNSIPIKVSPSSNTANNMQRFESEKNNFNSNILDIHPTNFTYNLFSPGVCKKILSPFVLFFFIFPLLILGLNIKKIRLLLNKNNNLYIYLPLLSHYLDIQTLTTELEKQISSFLEKNKPIEKFVYFNKGNYSKYFSQLQKILLICQKSKYSKQTVGLSHKQIILLAEEANLIIKKIKLQESV